MNIHAIVIVVIVRYDCPTTIDRMQSNRIANWLPLQRCNRDCG